ncbi:LCP family protein [Paenibacillus ginsengarvi]|uniref:LytR family transcriptional regulator n=1 Tax=Paenibacillus ginsengarvi TaxID=400777 RepID=A0A3B0CU94_9BACL|nr:LCP family protein [Paenibacillus ginsengarvi]RKN86924.1 LytR family transcriptional regulator [Paenibacillus ginsengarvi]
MPSTALPPVHPRRPPKKRIKKTIWFIIFVIIIAVIAYGAYLLYKINSAIDKVGAPDSAAVTKPVSDNPVTVLLLGLDSRPKSASLNTDVIMVASFNPARKTASVVSIPRDTLIKVSGYSQLKANAYYAAFHQANKATADKKTKELFGKYLSVPIDYVARIDFKGFEDIVDQLGGLQLQVDMNMCYTDKWDGTNIRLTEGSHLLNGKQALDFVRYRKGNCQNASESNDIERNERQQQVIGQMVAKLKSVEGVLRLGSVIESASGSVETDIPASQIKSFIRTYMGIDRDNIKYVHLTGEWQSPYIYIRPDELKQAVAALQEQRK